MHVESNTIDFNGSIGASMKLQALSDRARLDAVIDLAKYKRVLFVGNKQLHVLEALNAVCDRVSVISDARGLDRVPAGIEVYEASLKKLPFDESSFDLVCCFDTFETEHEMPSVLKEMIRVTVPEGYVVVEFNNRLSLNYMARKIDLAIGRGSNLLAEAWMSPWVLRKIVPAGARLIDYRGLEIAQALPKLSFVPYALKLQTRAQKAALRSPLRFLADSFVATLQKEQPE